MKRKKPWSSQRKYGRDFESPMYLQWRNAVYERDGYKCRWPGCSCSRNLNAHHIKKWATDMALRFNIANGITLCYKHHKMVAKKEEQYETMFYNILLSEFKAEQRIKDNATVNVENIENE